MHRFIYELVVMKGNEMNESVKPVLTREATVPPIMFNPSDLGGEETGGQVFTMGVRVKSKAVRHIHIFFNHCMFIYILFDYSLQGFYSKIWEVESIEIQPDAWLSKVLPTTTSMWMVFVPLVLVMSLIAVVVYMIQRHRRLANSFSRFANSHYDPKTGATRIGDALDDDDHNDTPRFEDDEPLVIA